MAKLGDYIKVKHGFAFPGESISENNNGVVLVTPGNFEIGGGFKEMKCKYFSGEYSPEYVLMPGDIIVTMTDLSRSTDTLGYSAKVPDTGRIYLHNQRIGLVQFLTDEVYKDYIYWFLRTYEYHSTVAAAASGSVIKHTSPSRICDIDIELPTIKQQHIIADTLSAIDHKIVNNNRINDKLAAMRDALLPRLMSGEIDVSAVEL